MYKDCTKRVCCHSYSPFLFTIRYAKADNRKE